MTSLRGPRAAVHQVHPPTQPPQIPPQPTQPSTHECSLSHHHGTQEKFFRTQIWGIFLPPSVIPECGSFLFGFREVKQFAKTPHKQDEPPAWVLCLRVLPNCSWKGISSRFQKRTWEEPASPGQGEGEPDISTKIIFGRIIIRNDDEHVCVQEVGRKRWI